MGAAGFVANLKFGSEFDGALIVLCRSLRSRVRRKRLSVAAREEASGPPCLMVGAKQQQYGFV